MRVKYINSATVIIESGGIKVLCDPWLLDGAYYGSWCHYPPLEINLEHYFNVDYIYISHIHPDHLHLETLKHFPKNIPIATIQNTGNSTSKSLKYISINQEVLLMWVFVVYFYYF